MKYLVTGAAGFIGFHVSKRLLEAGHQVVGIDNLNDYYDVTLKEYRLAQLEKEAEACTSAKYHFIKGNIADRRVIQNIFRTYHPDIVVNLAAQAGAAFAVDSMAQGVQQAVALAQDTVRGAQVRAAAEQFAAAHRGAALRTAQAVQDLLGSRG